MTITAAIRFLRRNALGTIPRNRAAVIAGLFGRPLSDLGPEFRKTGRVAVPELACALAGIEVEIPTHLIHLISQHNTERASMRLQRHPSAASWAPSVAGPQNSTIL